MKVVTVCTYDKLKSALKDKETDEIIINDKELMKKIKTIRKIKKSAPWLVTAIIAAIPLIPFTGGLSMAPFAAEAMFASTVAGGTSGVTTIIILVTALGVSVMIGIFTDWEEVEIAGILKLKRKRSSKT